MHMYGIRRVSVVIHLTPAGVAANPAYRKWASALPGLQILPCALATPAHPGTGLGFGASARTVAKLNLVSPQLFPLPACCRPAIITGPAEEPLTAVPSRVESTLSTCAVTAEPAVVHEPTEAIPTAAFESVTAAVPAVILASPPVSNGRADQQPAVEQKGKDGLLMATMLLSVECAAGGETRVSDTACPPPLDTGELLSIPFTPIIAYISAAELAGRISSMNKPRVRLNWQDLLSSN